VQHVPHHIAVHYAVAVLCDIPVGGQGRGSCDRVEECGRIWADLGSMILEIRCSLGVSITHRMAMRDVI
jgi:hypothetical protein